MKALLPLAANPLLDEGREHLGDVPSLEDLERIQLKSWHDYTLRKQAEEHDRILRRYSPMDRFAIEAYAATCVAEALARADLAGAK